MSETKPILMAVHDQFDVYERYPYTDHSAISRIAIASQIDGYRITTYPEGCGNAFDGLAVDVTVPGGIFSDAEPTRAEISRDSGGLMSFTVESDTTDGGMTVVSGTLSTLPKREGLTLPGDEEFGLIADLHGQVRALKEPVQETVSTLGVAIEATGFSSKRTGGNVSYDHGKKVATLRSGSRLHVSGKYLTADISLDGTTQQRFDDELPETDYGHMVYRAGEATITEAGAERVVKLDMDALVAFAGLHSRIQQLYR